MKKFFYSFLLLVLTSNFIHSQNEGYLNYKIVMSSDDPDMAMTIAMMEGSSMEIYFKNAMTRTDIRMGMFMDLNMITNETTKKVIILTGGMMGDYGILSNFEEMEMEDQKEPLKVELTKETKEIVGFKCKKAIITDADGKTVTYWYTDKIKYNKAGNQFFNYHFPGIPLEMTMTEDAMNMTFTAVIYEKKVDSPEDIFLEEIPTEYTIMTYEEFMNIGNQ